MFFRCVYLCMFVCLVVEDVQIEMVAHLTTAVVLAVMKRYVASRGKPKMICNNATHFVEARRELSQL